jgi:hypothetical protein
MLWTSVGSSHRRAERMVHLLESTRLHAAHSSSKASPHYTANAISYHPPDESAFLFLTTNASNRVYKTYLHMSSFTLGATFSRFLMTNARSSTLVKLHVSRSTPRIIRQKHERGENGPSPQLRGLYEHTDLVVGLANSDGRDGDWTILVVACAACCCCGCARLTPAAMEAFQCRTVQFGATRARGDEDSEANGEENTKETV